jgi:hypothetical protein
MTGTSALVSAIKRRRVRRVALFATIVALAAGAGTGVTLASASPVKPAIGTPSRPVDTDINAYVLFATQTLSLKGAENANFGHISGGDIGVNAPWTPAANPAWSANGSEMNVCSNGSLQMDPGSQVVADSLRASNLCGFWDVYANQVVGSPAMVPQNSGSNPFTPPVLTMPAFPSFACNAAQPVTVPKHGSITLPPGVYGDLNVRDNATVQFLDGTYTFCNLNAGQGITLNNTPNDTFRFAGSFSVNQGGVIGPNASPVYVQGTTANFSVGSTISALFYAPNGQVNLGRASTLFGKFWAQTINSDWNVNINYNPNAPTSTTTTTEETTFTF